MSWIARLRGQATLLAVNGAPGGPQTGSVRRSGLFSFVFEMVRLEHTPT